MAGSIAPNIIDDSLILYLDVANTKSYPTTGTTWNDLSKSIIIGTLTNGPTFNSSNLGYLSFDGIDDYVQINNPTSLQNQNLTISVWIYQLPQTTSIKDILDYDHAGSPLQGWVIQSEDATTNRYYYFAYYDGSGFQPSSGIGVGKGIQLVDNVWQNLTYTKNGTSVIGYLNGIQLVNFTAGNSNISYQPNRNLRIANVVSIYQRQYKGNISQVSIYNRALTSTEVLQNYNSTKSRFGL